MRTIPALLTTALTAGVLTLPAAPAAVVVAPVGVVVAPAGVVGPAPTAPVSVGRAPLGRVPVAPGSVPAAPPELPEIPHGAYGWPVAGFDGGAPSTDGVVRRFLPPPTPYGRGHRGVDLAASSGAPVVSAGGGTVVFAGPLAGRGVVSVVHPGGLRTTYEPVTTVVRVGAVVARGTVLGTLAPGHPDCPVTACLHWGLRWAHPPGAPREQYLDPLLLVGLGRTRLWPPTPTGT